MSPIATSTATAAPTKPNATPAPTHQSVANLSQNPLERTYRGNKAGTLHLQGFPSCAYATDTDEKGLLEKREWIKRHLAVAFRFWGKSGFGDGPS
jgi:hypothetical protein